jgi:hypothetical protein
MANEKIDRPDLLVVGALLVVGGAIAATLAFPWQLSVPFVALEFFSGAMGASMFIPAVERRMPTWTPTAMYVGVVISGLAAAFMATITLPH